MDYYLVPFSLKCDAHIIQQKDHRVVVLFLHNDSIIIFQYY